MTALLTQGDKANQNFAKPYVEAHLGCSLHDYPDMFKIDWYGERGGDIVCNAEFKHRLHLSTSYETVFLSVRKWDSLMALDRHMGIPGYYVVRWLDAMGIIRVLDVPNTCRVEVGGHRYMRRPEDQEVIIHVPVSLFQRIDGVPEVPRPKFDPTKSPYQKDEQ